MLAWAEQAAVRLAALDGDDERVTALRDRRDALLAELGDLAGQVSRARAAAAAEFSTRVTTSWRRWPWPTPRSRCG